MWRANVSPEASAQATDMIVGPVATLVNLTIFMTAPVTSDLTTKNEIEHDGGQVSNLYLPNDEG